MARRLRRPRHPARASHRRPTLRVPPDPRRASGRRLKLLAGEAAVARATILDAPDAIDPRSIRERERHVVPERRARDDVLELDRIADGVRRGGYRLEVAL